MNNNIKPDIVAFDLSEEMFCEYILQLLLRPDRNYWRNKIGVLDGLEAEGSDYYPYDIWLLKNNTDNHDSKEQPDGHQSMVWNQEFRIEFIKSTKEFEINRIKMFAIRKTGGVLTHPENYLTIYDPKASTSRMLLGTVS